MQVIGEQEKKNLSHPVCKPAVGQETFPDVGVFNTMQTLSETLPASPLPISLTYAQNFSLTSKFYLHSKGLWTLCNPNQHVWI